MGLISTKDSDGDNEIAYDFYFLTSKKALIIFTRNPQLDKVKTRLAKTIGDEAALRIYNYLLQHTATTVALVNADKFVFYTKSIHKNDIWDHNVFRKKLQYGEDLGVRMKNAFNDLFQLGYKEVIIIGRDLLDLKPKHIEEAFNKLENNDVIIGPAKDGGYYLLGMKTLYPQVFKNKNWGTSTIFQETMEDLKDVDVHLLEELNDIDTFEDLNKYSELKKLLSVDD